MQGLPPWKPWRSNYLVITKSFTLPHPPRSLAHSYPLLTRPLRHPGCRYIASESNPTQKQDFPVAKEIKDRVEELQEAAISPYPRANSSNKGSSLSKFNRTYKDLEKGHTKADGPPGSYQGRIDAVRTAGNLLFFIDIFRKNLKMQVLVNHSQMPNSGITKEEFIARRKLLRRGDNINVTGFPHRTASGQLSLSATELPRILSPCLHQFPVQKSLDTSSSEGEPHFVDKHVEMLANKEATYLILRRSQVIGQMRDFLNRGGFTEVQTPVLSAGAGGAIARSFETNATEFSNKQLSLRVAPELWLKKLVLGGLERVFEIGTCFRNEGLDSLHNPEFTTCEFYSAYTSIQELLKSTEIMLNTMVGNIRNVPVSTESEPDGLKKSNMPPLALDAPFFKGPYRQIDFLVTLNETLGFKLPDLDAESAEADLLDIFQQKKIALPARPTLPRLLDKLSALYLEPQCDKPTWIINHPECLSPLSKTFPHPSPNVAQRVAARAELFIHGHEIVNCYEEENSPFEQRRKFLMQQRYSTAPDSKTPDPEAMPVDEDYLKALEWGLPPTGGWGCGIDRLVMLLTGKDRINDVLTFGNLRTVTRAPEYREMVRLATSPLDSFKQNAEHDAASEDAKKKIIHTVSTKRPLGRNTSKAKPQLDAMEQAVIKIREKLNREKSGRTKQSRIERGSSVAEQKRLATWLAGRGEPNATEKLLNK